MSSGKGEMESEAHLWVQVEALQCVDGGGILCDVVIHDGVQAIKTRLCCDDRFEV